MSGFQISQELLESIEASVNGLSNVKFTPDPLLPGQYSKITSIVSSAQKRHGSILEQSILARLQQNTNLTAWSEPKFSVSKSAETLISTYGSDPSKASSTSMPYPNCDADIARAMQVDLIVYDKTNKSLVSYEIKRGNGMHDSKSKASMLKNLLTQQILLKSYGKTKGFDEVQTVDSKVIFYYGKCSLDAQYSITSEDLDTHFNFEVKIFVEEITELFRSKIVKIVNDLVGSEANQLKNQLSEMIEQGFNEHAKKSGQTKDSWFRKIF
jgi:hypothetical protein